jgi:1-aminocyclopropane-1-carboxylate deaminase/D-cysteine desulfhydrase-like pyridoxal-dependent ACC family enzyme
MHPKAGLGMATLRASELASLPRLRLAELPTPLEPAPRLGAAIGSTALSIKREDLSGLGLGGNKPRQIEAIFAAAEAEGCNAVVTTAGAQSNFCRATAAAAARLGWRCVLLLRGSDDTAAQGNLLLDRVFGAEVHWIDVSDPYSDEIQRRLDAMVADVAADGDRPYLIRLPGVTGPLAAAAAVSLADELLDQWARPADHVVGAAGSGLTAAGLVAGFARAGVPTKVIAISVQQPTEFIAPLILKRAAEALELLGVGGVVDRSRLVVHDRFIGPGYGMPTDASLGAIATAGRFAGLVLDPAYSGKALGGLIALLAEGEIGPHEHVSFIHTGGAPGLFVAARQVAASLAG